MDKRTIHLINPLWDSNGGSEWRTLMLHRALRPYCNVILWSEAVPDPSITAIAEVRRIDAQAGQFPKGGTMVFVGVYFEIGPWLEKAEPERVVLIFNTNNQTFLNDKLERLRRVAPHGVEMVYTSEQVAANTGLPGRVETSLVDLDRFAPAEERRPGPFRVGRLSRSVPQKHYQKDIELYLRLAASGCEIKIMGPDPRWKPEDINKPGISLLATGAVPPEHFLRDLDCFLYRTATFWPEPWGRVVSEAMACGLPVVVHRSGGYSSIVEHGRNGFLFDTQLEAYALVLQLKEDEALRQAIGAAARATAERLFSDEARAKIVDFYLP